MRQALAALLVWLALALPGLAGDAPVLIPDQSRITLGQARGMFASWRPRPITLDLALSQPVPYRAFMMADPPRLVIDIAAQAAGDLPGADGLPGVAIGARRAGWSRITATLPGPYRIETATQTGDGPARLVLRLSPVAARDFAARSSDGAALPPAVALPPAAPRRLAPDGLLIAIDPGHGGHDPGAEVAGVSEAALMLGFAQELAAALREAGIAVVMTRERDVYVGLEARMTVARNARADLFISLHADALPQGEAAGAAIYLWNRAADSRAAAQLAARHDRDDLLSGLDLGGSDDHLAATLMDLARTETQPRSQNIAQFLASRLSLAGIGMHRRPVRSANFAVLKSPDIPSVLVELGFLTDAQDRANLTDPQWRSRAIAAMVGAIRDWHRDDAARAAGLRH